jgi:hypothetical protein
MIETVSKRFSSAFDPMNQDHALWLRALHLSTVSEQAPNTLMNNNPFGIAVTKKEIIDWIDVLFTLAMKYSIAVLEGKAWIPPPRTEGLSKITTSPS